MNDADSKKLEEIEAITRAVRNADKQFEIIGGSSRHWVRECFIPALEEEGLLIISLFKVKEQDREIERLQEEKKAWRRLLEISKYQNYQRRHRKWALERARTNLEFYNLTYEHAQQFKSRAEKAEAELKQRREENLMLRDGIEIGRKVSVSNLCHAEKAEARVNELEAEKEKV